MTKRFDTIVCGLGAVGSAALYHLARLGQAAAGFDAFAPPHANGSSHGETRMIREAYYEDPGYVPLVRRAYDLWHELAALSGEKLIVETGGVFAGPAEGGFIAGIRRSAAEHGIPVESLPRPMWPQRAPWLALPADMVAVTEPRAGLLLPERCIAAHLAAASARGASVRVNEPVTRWQADSAGVTVETADGSYRAGRLIQCTGAWFGPMLASAGVVVTITRQPIFWFETAGGRNALGRFPVFAIEHTPGRLLYGFPDLGSGLKVAIHIGGAETTVETIDRQVREEEWREMETLLARFLPGVAGSRSKAAVCMYTNTTDHHFVIDEHPGHPNVFLVSACSGHGFKFSSAVGEAAAQWASGNASKLDLSRFSIDRFRR